jgi:hypothetical protein
MPAALEAAQSKMSSSLNRSTFSKIRIVRRMPPAVRCLCWSLPLTRIPNRSDFAVGPEPERL